MNKYESFGLCYVCVLNKRERARVSHIIVIKRSLIGIRNGRTIAAYNLRGILYETIMFVVVFVQEEFPNQHTSAINGANIYPFLFYLNYFRKCWALSAAHFVYENVFVCSWAVSTNTFVCLQK